MMTTLAALFGALPFALAAGPGAAQMFGVDIISGLILDQGGSLLYTTPVIYLMLDGFESASFARHGDEFG